MHFFNPPRYLHLLEIIPTAETSKETIDAARRFSDRILGKGIVVAKDVPGFVANRLGVFGMVLAIRLMETPRPHDRRSRRAHGRAHRPVEVGDVPHGGSVGHRRDRARHQGTERNDRRGLRAVVVGDGSREEGSGRREERRGILQARRQGDSHARLEDRRVQAAGQARYAGAHAPRAAAARRAIRVAQAVGGPRGRLRQRILIALLPLRADHDAGDRLRHSVGRSRDRVGLRVGGRPVQADGHARRRFPAPRVRRAGARTSPRCCAKCATGSTRATGRRCCR